MIAIASIGTLIGPPIAGYLITYLGWRMTFLILGLPSLILIPLAVFIKRWPEDADLSPDFNMVSDKATLLGQWSPLAAKRFHPSYDAQGLTAGFRAYPLSFGKSKGTALAVLTGVLFLVITIFVYSSRNVIATFSVPSMVDAGARATSAAASLSAMAIAIPIGALVLGILSDFFDDRLCLGISLLIFGSGILMFSANPLSSAVPLMMGFGQGGFVCLVTVVVANYFGRCIVGSLRGIIGLFASAASAIAPLIVGNIYDATGSFSTGFIVMGVGVLICAMLTILMRPPRYDKLPII